MRAKELVVFLLIIAVSFVRSNEIRCFACDDCTKEKPSIVQCSANNRIDVKALSNAPANPVYPWDTILTPPPLVGGNNGGNYWDPWNPLLTPPPLVGGNNGGNYWDPWNPNLTPPPLVGGNNGGNYWDPWNPLLTPPPLVGGNYWGGNYWDPWNPNYTIPPPIGVSTPWYGSYRKATRAVKPQKRFVCVTIMSQEKDRTKTVTHRRGCAEIEGYASGICENDQTPFVEGGITSCRVCGHSLCNE